MNKVEAMRILLESTEYQPAKVKTLDNYIKQDSKNAKVFGKEFDRDVSNLSKLKGERLVIELSSGRTIQVLIEAEKL